MTIETRNTYLIQQPIGRIGHNPQYTLLADPALGGGDGWLAVVAQAGLGEDGKQLGPVGARGLVEGGAEEPVGRHVAEEEVDGLAAHVELSHVVRGEVDGHSAAGSSGFCVFVEGAD